ncbi:MAG: 30S ribosomal protein S17 [Candidatus Diapherotrites archaeon]|nr:30S ribosomal protein S17 [Candidatus Diapherotrites archaeon]
MTEAKTNCTDDKCAVHGHIKVRGNVYSGLVVSAKPSKTIKIERHFTKYVAKYERYKKIKSGLMAHNPECISAKEGDFVKIGETRKLSKTKNFVVLEILGHGRVEKREYLPEKEKEEETE